MSKQTWLVSGSAAGLGRDIVERALAEGHEVVATARRPAALDDLAARYPGQLRTFVLDVTDASACEAAVRFAIDTFGHLDVLVNNAGYGNMVPFENMGADDFRDQIETNLFGVVQLTRAALPHMRERRHGWIINVSSVGGRLANPGLSAYQAAKWAVGGFSGVLAGELAGLGVHVCTLEPGGMRTDWARRASTDTPAFHTDYAATVGAMLELIRQYAGNEAGDPRRVAEVVLRIAAHPQPPVHLLLGSDAVHYASLAEQARRESDARWVEVSRGTDVGDERPVPPFPAY
ncbi:MAG: 3-oxoacyl-[acyl-carrier-protein] reductase FabG [Luteibacter sp.]|uniref:SDR family NAD(P)-dependent oxidoreductase n=1 Tax=Luteibacter sp. TaxID=1886636 RepID=UPI0013846691|nr:SDR family NAD(P)-dependent oxidoreductase [Luteibacter sp.]KAF1005739.1 MAG: 3-oxoacyl-[acyl-carrier-protein] reductase FabG [Luteibacter sp.]